MPTMSSLSDFLNLPTTIQRLENTMGQVANALTGVTEQLAKIKEEVARSGQMDAQDQEVLRAVREGINAIDEMNPDVVDEPTPAEPSEPGQPTE
ncbi:hypothetical protein NDR87_30870 [Nocardia sp. CDC159]|uniref:Uncharacterized protein n=1 Tax=Nocardia pulmonis TaxID=2951408 RepID=A0A9X2EBZ6_9NOCA|nr:MULTISPECIES: hypothetical protein [Nocardia]MCM6778047.1 hypothetical protein [Nocardia pulmonis]MCM6790782.1 hypothetical protein [Nocardia sp. CDC159]